MVVKVSDNTLRDTFGRKFEYLRLSITDVCNFKCNYCLPDGYQSCSDRNFLNKSEISTLVSAFASLGTKKVRITGGEPCLRKDLPEIISLCKQTPGIERVALTTNGFNLENNIDELKASGLDAINISVDSLDPRAFHQITGHNKLEKVLRGIERGIELGIDKVKLNAVLLKSFNQNALSLYLPWIKNKNVSVRFIELMQTGNNLAFFEQNHMSGSDVKRYLLDEGWQPVIRDKLAGPAQEFFHPDYLGRIGLIMPYSKDFCSNCNRLRVSALGNLHLCLFAEQGIPLRQHLTEQNVETCIKALKDAMFDKKATHELQQGFTGATTHLAMLGG